MQRWSNSLEEMYRYILLPAVSCLIGNNNFLGHLRKFSNKDESVIGVNTVVEIRRSESFAGYFKFSLIYPHQSVMCHSLELCSRCHHLHYPFRLCLHHYTTHASAHAFIRIWIYLSLLRK